MMVETAFARALVLGELLVLGAWLGAMLSTLAVHRPAFADTDGANGSADASAAEALHRGAALEFGALVLFVVLTAARVALSAGVGPSLTAALLARGVLVFSGLVLLLYLRPLLARLLRERGARAIGADGGAYSPDAGLAKRVQSAAGLRFAFEMLVFGSGIVAFSGTVWWL